MKRVTENRQKFPFNIEIMTGTTTASIRRKQLFEHFIRFLYLYWEPNIGKKKKIKNNNTKKNSTIKKRREKQSNSHGNKK